MIGRLSGLTDLIKFLGQVDTDDIWRLVEASKTLGSEVASIREKIAAALVIADVVTDYVPGEIDDKVVESLKLLLESDAVEQLIDVVSDLLEDQHVDNLSIVQSSPDGIVITAAGEDGEAKAVPWPLVISVAVEVLKILIDMRRNRD